HRQVLDQLSHPACIRQPDSHASPPARSQWSAGRTPPSILLRESRRASAWRLPVALDEQPRECLRALRGPAVALAGLDDRALHQDMEREREAVDVAEAGLARECAQHHADVLEMRRTRAPDRMAEVGRLEQ